VSSIFTLSKKENKEHITKAQHAKLSMFNEIK